MDPLCFLQCRRSRTPRQGDARWLSTWTEVGIAITWRRRRFKRRCARTCAAGTSEHAVQARRGQQRRRCCGALRRRIRGRESWRSGLWGATVAERPLRHGADGLGARCTIPEHRDIDLSAPTLLDPRTLKLGSGKNGEAAVCGPWALRGGRWLVEGCKVRRRSLRSATEAKRTAAPRAGDDATRLPSPVLNVDGCGWWARQHSRLAVFSGGRPAVQRADGCCWFVGATPAACPWPAGMPMPACTLAARADCCWRRPWATRSNLRGSCGAGGRRCALARAARVSAGPVAGGCLESWGLWRTQMVLLLAALLRGGTTGAGATVAASLAARQYVASIRLPALRLIARRGRLAEERTAGAAGPGVVGAESAAAGSRAVSQGRARAGA